MTTFAFANSVLLNAAVATALAILVWTVAAIPFVRRRPGLRHCLWVIVLLKLVTPPLFEWSILPNWFASEPLPATHARAIPLDESLSVSLTDTKSIVASQPLTGSGPSTDWMFVLIVITAMGTLAVVISAVVQAWRLRRALRRAAANDERLNRIAAQAGKSMGVASPPPVCVVGANVSPLLWMRWSGPLVVVPRRLSDEMSDDQLGCVVAHEIAHYLRRDHWTNLLSLLVAAVCWWNPVVWWARRELRIAQEACCDALVISRSVASRRKYAETLFQALEFLQAERSLLPALASGFGNKSSTERRFEMIANPLVNHRLSWWSYPVVLAALAVLPCMPSFTQAQDQAGLSQEINVNYGLVPVEIKDLDGDPLDANTLRVEIKDLDGDPLGDRFWRRVVVEYPGQTDRRVYKHQRSKLGIVVLAFDRESGKLAWSSEIELPADGKPVAGQRFLLHTGGGVVTIASLNEDKSLSIQELDAETGKVTCQTRLTGTAKDQVGKSQQETLDREVIILSDDKELGDLGSKAAQEKLRDRITKLQQQQKEPQKSIIATDAERQHFKSDAEQLQQKIDALLQQQKELRTQLKIKEQQQVDAKEIARQLQQLLDEQLTRVGEDGLRGPQRDWVLRQAKQLGDTLVIDTAAVGVKRPTVETAGAVWRLINRDAPIESISMVREDGKDRMIIKGKANKHRRIILEIRTDGDTPGSTDGGLPPGRDSTEDETGASTQPHATDPLVRKAVQYLSRQRRNAHERGFDYAPETEPSAVSPDKEPDEKPGEARKPASTERRPAWLDAKGVVPTENQVAVAALCWGVKE